MSGRRRRWLSSLGRRRRWLSVLGLACLAALFASFDGSLLVLALPAIAGDFSASVPALANLGSALQAGVLAGLPLAVLGDRWGRRRLLVGAVAGFSLADIASGLAPGLAWLAAARALAVACETAAASVAAALVIEESPASSRGLALAAVTLAGGAGVGLTTLLYPLLAPSWRPLYLAGGLGLLPALALAAWLPESRAWRPHRGAPLALLGRRAWRRRLAVVVAVAGLGALLYEPAGLFVAFFASRDLHLGAAVISAVYLLAGLLSIPALALGGRLSDGWGRRRLGAGLALGAGLGAAATFTGTPAAYWLGSVAWGVLGSAAGPPIAAWYGELFPTRARSSAQGVDAAAGALGAVAGLQLVALLEPRLGLGPSLVVEGAAALAGALLLLALPETAGRPLPE